MKHRSFIKNYEKLDRLRNYNPPFKLHCRQNRCGYLDQNGKVQKVPYNSKLLTPIDNVYLPIIINQHYQSSMIRAITPEEAVNRIDKGELVHIGLFGQNGVMWYLRMVTSKVVI